jgi:sugar/nucleoside kinase (ribokinase family)
MENTSSQTIFTLGHLTVDDIVLLSEGRLYRESSGGDALFSAIGAWVWHSPVGLIARAGQAYPQVNIERIQAAGIACHLRRVPYPDIRNWALYEPDGSRQFLNHARSGSYAQMSITGEEIPEGCLGAAGYHIAPMPVDAQASVVRKLRDPLPTSSNFQEPKDGGGVEQRQDPHPVLSHEEREKWPAAGSLDENDVNLAESHCLITLDTFPQHLKDEASHRGLLGMIALVDAFLPSRGEAAILFGSDEPQAAARAFGALGVPLVCIKMGAEGALLYETGKDAFCHIPICPVETVDPTGAGDAFCGGFLAGLLAGRDPLGAACCGAVSASYIVQQVGALNMLGNQFSDRLDRFAAIIDKVNFIYN